MNSGLVGASGVLRGGIFRNEGAHSCLIFIQRNGGCRYRYRRRRLIAPINRKCNHTR